MTPRPPCRKCDLVHERCAGHTRAGRPCRQWPMADQDVCKMHGGKAPQALAAAERRRQEAAAREALATYGGPVDVNPVEALLEEVRWTAGHVAWLRERVREVEQRALTMGVTEQTIDPEGGKTVKIKAAASVWLNLYQQERRHLVEVCGAALRAGIEERAVRLAERQGDMVARAIEAILHDLNLTPAQQNLVPKVVPRHLRALAGGQAA